jgi:YesN/AraC family two-component response regulator
VKELTELHGGKIIVASQLGEGTAFTCFLPLNRKISTAGNVAKISPPQVKPAYVEDSAIEEEEKISRNGKPVVLVVEDQPDVRKYIRQKLNSDYSVVEAKNGVEGFAIAKEQVPDIVVSDVMMPKMDGFELCGLLKMNAITSHIPVILLTARAADADRLGGLETGADAYLVKPFNTRELQIWVRNLIEIRNKMRAKLSDKLVVKPSEITVTSKDRIFMQDVLTIAEKHLSDENFSVEELASELHVSTSQINRKLKALINQSAQQFIRSVRMQRAEELLKKKAGTVAEVAYEVGFSDPGYFTRVFKNYFGYPPSEVKTV